MTLKGLANIVYGEENKLFENAIAWMDEGKYYPELRNYDTKKWLNEIKQDNFYLSEDQIRSLTKKCIIENMKMTSIPGLLKYVLVTIFVITIELHTPIFNMVLLLTFAQFRRTFGALESYERNITTVTDDFNAIFEENVLEPTHSDRALIYF